MLLALDLLIFGGIKVVVLCFLGSHLNYEVPQATLAFVFIANVKPQPAAAA